MIASGGVLSVLGHLSNDIRRRRTKIRASQERDDLAKLQVGMKNDAKESEA